MGGKTTLWCPVLPRSPHCPKPKIGGGGGMAPVCMRFQPWGTPPWYRSRKRVFDHFSRFRHFFTIFYPLARVTHRYQAPATKPTHARHTYPWSLHTSHWKAGPRGLSDAHEPAPALTDPCFSRPRRGARGGGGARRGPGSANDASICSQVGSRHGGPVGGTRGRGLHSPFAFPLWGPLFALRNVDPALERYAVRRARGLPRPAAVVHASGLYSSSCGYKGRSWAPLRCHAGLRAAGDPLFCTFPQTWKVAQRSDFRCTFTACNRQKVGGGGEK
jgi:hypothetical protein